MRTRNAQDFLVPIRKYFRAIDPASKFSYEVPLGNIRLDMLVECNGEKWAIEVKSKMDDIQRGFAELCIAKAYGIENGLLVTTKTRAKKLDMKRFQFYSSILAHLDRDTLVPNCIALQRLR